MWRQWVAALALWRMKRNEAAASDWANIRRAVLGWNDRRIEG
jgi:hypothetical protein